MTGEFIMNFLTNFGISAGALECMAKGVKSAGWRVNAGSGRNTIHFRKPLAVTVKPFSE
jgi:hypothetical protein